MNLALDIGNTRTKLGWSNADGVWTVEALDTAALQAEVSASRHAGTSAVRELFGGLADATSLAIVSVVPEVSGSVRDFLQSARPEVSVFEVSPGCRIPFEMGYRTPATLGNDRLAAASAAWMEYANGSAIVVIDAGTAVTFEVVDAAGVYRGGAIAPGPVLLSKALRTGTAQLPAVDDLPGDSAIGSSTREAIQSGIHWGFRESVSGMLRRFREELADSVLVVATGGWAADLARHIDTIDLVDPYLVLRGASLLRELNARAAET